MSMPVLKIKLQVMAGRNLVAKERGMLGMGRAKSSDPYVEFCTLRDYEHRKSWGKTNVVHKTLNPTWEQQSTFSFMISVKDIERTVMCFHVYDSDKFNEDNPMGTVTLPIPITTALADWYPVERGSGAFECSNATGDLQIEVSSVLHTTYTPPQPDSVPGGPGRLPSKETYLLTEKLFSFSGDTFKVKNARSGKTEFSIHGKALSVRDRLDIRDAKGKPICILANVLFDLAPSYSIWTYERNYSNQSSELSMDGVPLFKFAVLEKEIFSMATTLHCSVVHKDGRLHSSILCKDAMWSIGLNATLESTQHGLGILATCNQSSVFQYNSGNTYGVHVAAGADPVLCLCLCIAMDHLKEQRK